jgi:hypothetical protein
VFKFNPSAAMRWLRALVLITLATVVPTVAQARLYGQAREVFIEGSFRKCVESSKRNDVARNLPANIVSRLCTCTVNYTADRLTNQDAAIGTYGNRAEKGQIDRKSEAFNRAGMQTCKQMGRRS